MMKGVLFENAKNHEEHEVFTLKSLLFLVNLVVDLMNHRAVGRISVSGIRYAIPPAGLSVPLKIPRFDQPGSFGLPSFRNPTYMLS
jgi:hypothetical protein